MRILVACEFSGVVRDAFLARGHDAYSCDLLQTDRQTDRHIQADVLTVLDRGWDMMIAFPPCTYLCSSGLHWNKRRPGRAEKTEEALQFVRELLDAPIEKIALENPIGCISTRIRKPDQVIQPWEFGHDASKQTCLWLKGIAPLCPTKIVPPKDCFNVKFAADCEPCECCDEPWCDEHQEHFADCSCVGPTHEGFEYTEIKGHLFAFPEGQEPKRFIWGNQTPSGQNKLGPSPDRWKERSKTYQGIADAMAEQWSIG